MATRKCNPSFIKGRLKKVPKGKRKGKTFLHKGRRFMVMSYVTKTGKRVRYAKAVVKSKRSARRLGRRNPVNSGIQMFNPLLAGSWRVPAGAPVGAYSITRRKGIKVRKVVMRGRKPAKGEKRVKIGRFVSPVAYHAPKAPKGAKAGTKITRGGKRFVVIKYSPKKGKAKGKRIAILRRLPKKK
jgi:hypothetical protein